MTEETKSDFKRAKLINNQYLYKDIDITKTKMKKTKSYLTKKRKAKKMINKYLLIIVILFILPMGIIGHFGTKLEIELGEALEATTIEAIENEEKATSTTNIKDKIGISGYIEVAKFNATVTAYSEIDSCHYPNCAMSSGERAYIGAVACPRNIKLGTRVVIDNTPYICEDRVSLMYPNRFDIFMGYGIESYNKAINYGNQTKEIKLYKKEM